MGQTGDERCQQCGKKTCGRDGVRFSEDAEAPGGWLCDACYNREIAERIGIAFQHPELRPMELADANGTQHRFRFATRLLGEKTMHPSLRGVR